MKSIKKLLQKPSSSCSYTAKARDDRCYEETGRSSSEEDFFNLESLESRDTAQVLPPAATTTEDSSWCKDIDDDSVVVDVSFESTSTTSYLDDKSELPAWNKLDSSDGFVTVGAVLLKIVRPLSIVDTYVVHRNVVIRGARKAKTLTHAFREEDGECDCEIARMELDDVAADVVPQVLDFVYYGTVPTMTSHNATALAFVASFWCIAKLHELVMEFYKIDMNLENLHVYFQHAQMMDVPTVRYQAKCVCVEEFLRIQPSSPVLATVDVPFWLSVLSSPEHTMLTTIDGSGSLPNKPEVSRHSSRLLVPFIELHPKLSFKEFEQFTHASLLPEIDPSVASELLNWEQRLLQDECAPHKVSPSLRVRCQRAQRQGCKVHEDLD